MKMKQKTFEITRAELELVMRIINQPLNGSAARARNKFIKLTDKDYSGQFDSRKEILEKYSDKDENGKAKINAAGMYEIPADKQAEAKKELEAYYAEKLSYDYKENIAVMKEVVTIMQRTGLQFGVEDGKVYDEVLSRLESIIK